MRLPTLLVSVWCIIAQGKEEAADCTDSQNPYKTTLLYEDNALTSNIAIDWKKNKVYVVKKLSDSKFQAGVWDLSSSSYSDLHELPGLCSLAVDQELGNVYAGCFGEGSQEGVYVYDQEQQQFNRLIDQAVRRVYFHKVLYYIDYDNKLHTFSDGQSHPVEELQDISVRSVAIDNEGDWIFAAGYNTQFKKPGKRAKTIRSASSLPQVVVDPRGDAYGYNGAELFRIHTTNRTATKLVDLPGYCESLVFDKDNNIVYFDRDHKQLHHLIRC